MKPFLTTISAALLTAALTAPAMAQTAPAIAPVAPAPTRYGEHHRHVQEFDAYLDQHPEVRRQLNRNPRLIDDPAYMAKHPDLHEYMVRHPRTAAAFRRHPNQFIHREHIYNRSERRWDARHGAPADNR
jgi:hypothetical protein